MKRAYGWFKNLSNVGKISTLSTLALGSFFVTSAISSPPQPPTLPVPPTVAVPVTTTKTEVKTQPIPFENRNIDSSSLNKGTTRIETVGVDGVKTITYTLTLTDGVETNRTSSEAITTAPINQVTAVGTYVKPAPSCDPNYSGCVPVVSYDLDCGDIGFQVQVLGYDKHSFDRDDDGYGCESY